MTLSFNCPSPIQLCTARATLEDECGASLDPLTPMSRVETNDFMSLTATPDTEKGTEFLLKDGCGKIRTYYVDLPRVKKYDLVLVLATVNLPILSMLLGWDLLAAPTDPTDFIGYVTANDLTRPNPNPILFEGQARNANPEECAGSGAVFRHVFPLTKNWVLGDKIEASDANPLQVTLNGEAFNNPNYIPSFPDDTFPSWVPGGGDPDGTDTGTPPPILPGEVTADPIDLDWQAQIQTGGPYAGFSEADWFPVASSCNFLNLGS